ncbi:conserved hypothetical protein, partial [Ixodes scapularis]
FQLLNINARSLLNKSVDLEHVGIEQEPEVIVVTDTWLHSDIQDNEVCPPGYNIIQNENCGRGANVAIVVDRRLKCTVLQHPPGTESVWCKVHLEAQEVNIGKVYRPPRAKVAVVDKMNDFMFEFRIQHKNVVIAGDLNIPGVIWDQ